MVGWVGRWMGVWMGVEGRWMDRYMHESVGGWMTRWMGGRLEGWKNG